MDIKEVLRVVRAALSEDGAFRDITTGATVPGHQNGIGRILAKQPGVLAGLTVARAAFLELDPRLSFEARFEDGQPFKVGDLLAEITGPLAPILSAERVALNFLQRLSGTATITKELVQRIGDLPAVLVDTRKTTPGLRLLERAAVMAGGGKNHRFNLSDGVLIKDNHIAAAQARGHSIPNIIAMARAGVPHTARVEIEVTSSQQAHEAAAAGAEVVLLDNMTPEQMREAVDLVRGRAFTEASGGITLENVRQVAEAGVDIISSGALTHSAPAIDLSLQV